MVVPYPVTRGTPLCPVGTRPDRPPLPPPQAPLSRCGHEPPPLNRLQPSLRVPAPGKTPRPAWPTPRAEQGYTPLWQTETRDPGPGLPGSRHGPACTSRVPGTPFAAASHATSLESLLFPRGYFSSPLRCPLPCVPLLWESRKGSALVHSQGRCFPGALALGKAVSTVTGWLFLRDPRFSHRGSFLFFWATRSSPQLGSSCLCTEPQACAGGAGLRVSRRGSGRDLGRSPCCLGGARGRCRWTEGGVLGDPESPQAWPRCECPGRKVSQAPQGCGAGRAALQGGGPTISDSAWPSV